jgi:putative SOS response-associated peptidase YedK
MSEVWRRMCGRYYRRSDKQRIAEAFHLGILDDLPLEAVPSYNIAPTTMQPVIRKNRDTGEREMVAMRWGFVPHFAKSPAEFKGFSTINAKAETLLSRAIWRVPFHRRRCLVPADGFYEWKRLDEKTKQPYAFAMRNGEPFAFGGLWDGWKDPATGDWLQSFSIITTDPNELTATVHDRMPVILKPSDYDRWLDRTDAERPPVDLLRPYEAAEMTAHEVDPRVGNVRNDEPSLCNIWQCPPNSQ